MSVNLMSAIFETEFFDLKDEKGNVTKSSTAKLVLLALADHANDEGEGAYPSVERLCRKTALSEQTIRNTFDALRHNGIIQLAGKSKYGTNNHTINTKSFPKAIGKEVTVLTLYPLGGLTDNAGGSNGYLNTPHPLDPNHHITIQETPHEIPQNMPLDWYVQHGLSVPEKLTEKAIIEKTATDEFESAFSFGQLPWGSTSTWQRFSRWVVATFQNEPTVFRDYVEWRNGAGKYQAMSNKQIRQNPDQFIDTGYPDYKAHSAMNGRGRLPKPL